jgi:hypothetical protein
MVKTRKDMKIFKIMTLALMAIALWSCEKDGSKATLNPQPGGSALQASVTSLALDKPMLETDVITFTFTPPDYGYQAGITSMIELSTKADNFADGKVKAFALASNATTITYKGVDFNTMLLALNISTSESTEVLIRVKSTIYDTVEPVYSNAITINAKPYPLTAWVYVPGAYQGWNPATADSLVSPTGNGIYSGIITFTEPNQEFKITTGKNWDVNYGDAGNNKLVANGGNLKVATAGPKLVTVNLNDLTYKIEDNKVWSIIGDATAGGWDNDTDMRTKNDGNNVWTLTTDLVGDKLIKFRFGHDWGTNLGGNLNDLNPGGDNIKIATSGNYTITLTVRYDKDGKAAGGTASIVKN